MKKFLVLATAILCTAVFVFFANIRNAYCDYSDVAFANADISEIEGVCEPVLATETTAKEVPTTEPQTTKSETSSIEATSEKAVVFTENKTEPATVSTTQASVAEPKTNPESTTKQEPATVKQEHTTVKQEPTTSKQEPTTNKPVETTTSCQHSSTDTEIKEATCQSTGYSREYCLNCGECLSFTESEKTDHNFGDWQVDWNATPEYNGQESRTCSWCDYAETKETYWTASSANALYIPAASINTSYYVGDIDQYNTDHHDVVCNRDCFGANDVVFFGHATRSLGTLRRCSVGDKIYYTENGTTYTYVVTVSELAYLTSENAVNFSENIKGYDTGSFCLYYASVPTLHIFTCAPTAFNSDARWIVVAELAH